MLRHASNTPIHAAAICGIVVPVPVQLYIVSRYRYRYSCTTLQPQKWYKNYKLATACIDSRRIRAKLYGDLQPHGHAWLIAEFWYSTLSWLIPAPVASRIICTKSNPVLFVLNLFYSLGFTCDFGWVHFQKSYDCALFLHLYLQYNRYRYSRYSTGTGTTLQPQKWCFDCTQRTCVSTITGTVILVPT